MNKLKRSRSFDRFTWKIHHGGLKWSPLLKRCLFSKHISTAPMAPCFLERQRT
jgi:hypothetical protein